MQAVPNRLKKTDDPALLQSSIIVVPSILPYSDCLQGAVA